jgi:hypothetical protein
MPLWSNGRLARRGTQLATMRMPIIYLKMCPKGNDSNKPIIN